MRILPVKNNCSFEGLYKIDRKFIGDNTENFIHDNRDVIASHRAWEDDVFVLTPDKKDKEFEECVKKDHGKYWKSKPLSQLMMYSNLLSEIYRINYVSNDYKADWVDYTKDWQPSAKDEEDEIPF